MTISKEKLIRQAVENYRYNYARQQRSGEKVDDFCSGCAVSICRAKPSVVVRECKGIVLVGSKGAVGRGPKIHDCLLAHYFDYSNMSNHNHPPR